MPFCIVLETPTPANDNKKVITIVPQKWINFDNQTFKYPTHIPPIQAEKLVKSNIDFSLDWSDVSYDGRILAIRNEFKDIRAEERKQMRKEDTASEASEFEGSSSNHGIHLRNRHCGEDGFTIQKTPTNYGHCSDKSSSNLIQNTSTNCDHLSGEDSFTVQNTPNNYGHCSGESSSTLIRSTPVNFVQSNNKRHIETAEDDSLLPEKKRKFEGALQRITDMQQSLMDKFVIFSNGTNERLKQLESKLVQLDEKCYKVQSIAVSNHKILMDLVKNRNSLNITSNTHEGPFEVPIKSNKELNEIMEGLHDSSKKQDVINFFRNNIRAAIVKCKDNKPKAIGKTLRKIFSENITLEMSWGGKSIKSNKINDFKSCIMCNCIKDAINAENIFEMSVADTSIDNYLRLWWNGLDTKRRKNRNNPNRTPIKEPPETNTPDENDEDSTSD